MFKPMLRGVKVSNRLCPSLLWGGGWTLDNRASAPFMSGWKCKPVRNVKNTWLIGQAGESGCATVIRIQREKGWVWDVCVYDTTPKAVALGFKTGAPSYGVHYETIGNYPGFALAVVRLISECRQHSLS